MDARLASTKEVDLKSKVQSDFYRDERKRVSDRATKICRKTMQDGQPVPVPWLWLGWNLSIPLRS